MSIRLRAISTLGVLVVAGCATSQTGGRALGASATDTATVFAPGVVSTGDVFASTFTPDGRTVVFTKVAPPPRPMALMSSSLAGGRWTTPTVLPFSGVYRDL